MLSNLLKRLAIGVGIFTAVILFCIIVSRITYKNSLDKLNSALPPSNQAVSVSASESDEHTSETADCFYAKLEGENISIYSISGDKNEFMYSLKIQVKDISEKELEELKKGIILKDRQALASFEEDFTS